MREKTKVCRAATVVAVCRLCDESAPLTQMVWNIGRHSPASRVDQQVYVHMRVRENVCVAFVFEQGLARASSSSACAHRLPQLSVCVGLSPNQTSRDW